MSHPQRARMIIATLFGVLFLATVDNQLLIPLLPTLGREFGVSVQNLGWLFSSYALAAGVCSLLLGPLSDRFGRVVFLRLGLVFFFLIALSTYFSQGYTQLFWFRTMTGLAAGVLSTCTASFVGDFFPYERRGRIMGVVLSSYFAALILGVPLAAWVAQTWNWKGIFLASSLLAVLLLICTLLFFPGDRYSSSRSSGVRWSVYSRLILQRETAAAVAVSFGVSGATLAFLTFISDYLDQNFGLSPLQISWLFMTAGVAAAVGSPISGWISDRFTKRRVFLAANTVLVVPLLALDRVGWGGTPDRTFFCHFSLHLIPPDCTSHPSNRACSRGRTGNLSGPEERLFPIRNFHFRFGGGISILTGRVPGSHRMGGSTHSVQQHDHLFSH